MGKVLKVIGSIVLLFLILIIVVIFSLYQSNKWMINAYDMSGVTFRSEMFNRELITCSPSFSYRGSYFNEPWEIRGLKKDKCIVYFYELVDTNIETREYTENIHKCRLPHNIYSVPENINWSVLLNNENFCFW